MSVRPRRSLSNPELRRPSALTSIPRDPGRLWLDKNENLDPALATILRQVLLEIPPHVLNTYPEAGEAYRKLARWVGVSPECLFLTPGSDGAIRSAFEVFVEHGDRVIHTVPTFAMYPVYSQMFGAEVRTIEYERTAAGPRLDPAAVIKALRDRKPKLLCLPNPDSPTGTVVAPDALRGILAECEAAGTVLLLDEAYHPFYDWSAVPWTQTSGNLIVARTFAKAWGAAGLRIGYAVAQPQTIALLHKMRPMYEVSTIGIAFIERLLDHVDAMSASVRRLNDGKRYFVEEMTRLSFDTLTTYGNFQHVAFGNRAKAIHRALENHVLYRKDAGDDCLRGYSRFSVTTVEQFAPMVAAIQSAARESPA